RAEVDYAIHLEARAPVDRTIFALLDEAARVPRSRSPVLDRAVPVEEGHALAVGDVVAVRERRRVAVLPATDDGRGPLGRGLHGPHAQDDGVRRIAMRELARPQLLRRETVQRRGRREHVAAGLDRDLERR